MVMGYIDGGFNMAIVIFGLSSHIEKDKIMSERQAEHRGLNEVKERRVKKLSSRNLLIDYDKDFLMWF